MHTCISSRFRPVPVPAAGPQEHLWSWSLLRSGASGSHSSQLLLSEALDHNRVFFFFLQTLHFKLPTRRGADDGRTSQGICGKNTLSHALRVRLPDSTTLTQKLWWTHSAHLAEVSRIESSATGASHTPILRLIYVYHWYCSCYRKDWLGQRLSNKYRGVIPSRRATLKRTSCHKFFAVTDMSKNIPLYSWMRGLACP